MTNKAQNIESFENMISNANIQQSNIAPLNQFTAGPYTRCYIEVPSLHVVLSKQCY